MQIILAEDTVIVIACPDQGAGTDPEALGLAFHHQGLTFIFVHIVKLLRTWLIETETASRSEKLSFYIDTPIENLGAWRLLHKITELCGLSLPWLKRQLGSHSPSR